MAEKKFRLFPRLRKRLKERREERRKPKVQEWKEEGWLVKPEWMSEEEWLKMTPCAVCGRRGWDEWAVSDKEWKRYVPLKYQDKEVCLVCYERFEAAKTRLGNVRSQITKGSPTATLPSRNIVDLVRSQFNFSCPICEEIAEKVSTNFPDKVTQTRIYEAVYKLSSQDRKAQDEAMVTLEKLGVLEQVIAEVEQGWENLKGEKSD